MRNFAFAALGALTLAACSTTTSGSLSGGDGLNRVMDITNSTGVTMTNFHASNTGQNTWGPDQLGTSVLRSGKYMTINFNDGTGACYFDFKATFADGDILTTSNVNVCAETSWNYS